MVAPMHWNWISNFISLYNGCNYLFMLGVKPCGAIWSHKATVELWKSVNVFRLNGSHDIKLAVKMIDPQSAICVGKFQYFVMQRSILHVYNVHMFCCFVSCRGYVSFIFKYHVCLFTQIIRNYSMILGQ